MSSLKKSGAGASKSGSSRGGAQRAELTEEQKQEIKEAFDLFDTGQQAHREHTMHVGT
jgi:Ca2+-binding EF-hand superfamily protein